LGFRDGGEQKCNNGENEDNWWFDRHFERSFWSIGCVEINLIIGLSRSKLNLSCKKTRTGTQTIISYLPKFQFLPVDFEWTTFTTRKLEKWWKEPLRNPFIKP
jgi:hypothetical protein